MWLGLLSLVLAAPPSGPRFVPRAHDFERPAAELCYPSGLHITVVVDDRQPVVALTTVIDRGAADDPEGREGAAHLMEHLWFRAQANGQSVASQLADLGAENNAFTLGDVTVYSSVADAAALSGLLALEAQRLADPLAGITADIVEEERGIVDSERQLRGLVSEDYPRFLPPSFTGSTLRPGSREAIAAITRADLDAVATAYSPATTTVQITGPLMPSAVQGLVEEHFSEAQLFHDAEGNLAESTPCRGRAGEAASTPPTATPPAEPYTWTASIERPVVLVGWAWPAAYASDEPAMRIAAGAIHDQLRATLDTARFAHAESSCQFVPGPERSTLVCAASVPVGLSGERLLSTLAAAPSAVQQLDSAAIDLAGVRARTDLLIGLDALSPLTSNDALRDVLSNHYTGTPLWFADALTALGEFDADTLRSFLGSWSSPRQAWTAAILPEGADASVLAGADGAETGAGGSPKTDDGATDSRGGHRIALPDEPVEIEPSTPALAAPERRRLPNGVTAIVIPHGLAPVSHTALIVGGGPGAESDLGVDAWAWQLTGFDPSTMPNDSLQAAADLSATHLGFRQLSNGRAMTMGGSVATLDNQLYTLRAFAETTGRVGDTSRQEITTAVRRSVRRLSDQPSTQAHLARLSHVWGSESPYGLPNLFLADAGSRGGLSKIDRHIKKTWRPGNATVLVVGPVDPAAVHRQIEQWFGDWSDGPDTPQPFEPVIAPVPTARRADVVVAPYRATTQLNLACRAPDGSDAAVTDVAAKLLEQWAWRALRESEIGAYDPWVQAERVSASTAVHLGATVPAEHAVAAANAVDSGLSWLANEVSSDDVSRAGGRLRAGWAQHFVTTADVFEAALIHRQDVATYAQTHGILMSRVQADAVKRWAAACRDSAALTLVSPEPVDLSGTPWATR